MGTNYHNKSFALRLALKERLRGTRKWPIQRLQREYIMAFPWTINLFSLYVLFCHFKPRDATRGNSFFQMSADARANVRITNDKNKRKIPMRASRGLKWENKMYKLKRSIV